MSLPIGPISPSAIQAADPASITFGGSQSQTGTFQALLSDAVGSVQHFQENSQQAINNFLSGGGQELHQVALAAQQSQLAFDMFVQVRNKMISAYQEVMRMQL